MSRLPSVQAQEVIRAGLQFALAAFGWHCSMAQHMLETHICKAALHGGRVPSLGSVLAAGVGDARTAREPMPLKMRAWQMCCITAREVL